MSFVIFSFVFQIYTHLQTIPDEISLGPVLDDMSIRVYQH